MGSEMCIRDRGDGVQGGYDDGASAFAADVGAVSYTHLRAHETDSYLVCRLLLEKKKYAVFCLKKKNSFFFFFFLMIRRQPRSTHCISSAASDVYKRQTLAIEYGASSEDIARTCHAHPTLSEAFKEAAMATYSKPIHF